MYRDYDFTTCSCCDTDTLCEVGKVYIDSPRHRKTQIFTICERCAMSGQYCYEWVK
jgi:hypothetical protein